MQTREITSWRASVGTMRPLFFISAFPGLVISDQLFFVSAYFSVLVVSHSRHGLFPSSWQ